MYLKIKQCLQIRNTASLKRNLAISIIKHISHLDKARRNDHMVLNTRFGSPIALRASWIILQTAQLQLDCIKFPVFLESGVQISSEEEENSISFAERENFSQHQRYRTVDSVLEMAMQNYTFSWVLNLRWNYRPLLVLDIQI